MSFLQNLITDLREKRLWPLAVVLLIALVAVPVVISSGGSSSVPVAQVPPVGPSSVPTPALPAVSVTTTPSHGRLTGRERNPFIQQVKSAKTTSKSTGSATSSKSKSSSGSTTSGTSTTSGSVGGTTTTVTAPPIVVSTPPPAPTGLTGTQAYHVTVAMSSPARGLYTIDPVQRLSTLPSAQQSLLVELGVLSGGHRVLFVVQPGTLVRGPGRCTPGPIDCEIVSLAPGQIEWLGTSGSGTTGVTGVALMAVTAISAANYSSSAAAEKARNDESAVGRRLLSQSTYKSLSLFEFKPSLGALVDLSNVTVGGVK
jgi:hypothetical protein